jgi:hypothetical protein
MKETFVQVIERVREMRECTLMDLHDLVPSTYQSTGGWEPRFMRNVLSPLVQMGLLDVSKGFVGLTAEDVASQRVDFVTIRINISSAVTALEDLLGYDFWRHREAVLGEPMLGDWPEVFVVMPFDPGLRPVFQDHIRPVAAQVGWTVGRADDFFSANSVVREIWSAICNAKVIVADCTGRNANVFYEIGLAHAIGTPTILISQNLDDVPFDLRHLRAILYEYTPRGMRAFESALAATFEAV